jgi:hypothetical protein
MQATTGTDFITEIRVITKMELTTEMGDELAGINL